MKALFVDDDFDSISPAKEVFENNDIQCDEVLFEGFKDALSFSKPDFVVLDMMNGGTEADPAGKEGQKLFDDIWEQSFCPIIIYSANPDLCNAPKHPFIQKQNKGKGSEEELFKIVRKFMPYLRAKKDLSSNIEMILSKTLRDTATEIFTNYSTCAIDHDQVLIRLTRRRVAAEMDLGYGEETKLQPYEQYIYPVVGEDWLQGDIVKSQNNESFFLVLTPSCDLVRRKGKIKAKTILCAKCCHYEKNLIEQVLNVEKKYIEKKFISLLNSGIVGQYFVLPKIGAMPDLLANLKDFCLITEAEMVNYERIVSIDSPFREQLAWVFVSLAGRPGVPDRDFSTWANSHI